MQEQPFLVWPKLGPLDLLFVVLILLLIMAPFVGLAFYRIRESRKQARWILVGKYASKRGLDVNETNLVRAFFQALPVTEQEQIIHDQARFRSLLYQHLRNRHGNEERTGVRAIDKLFPDIKHWHAILSPKDLQPGEICALEFEAHHITGTVLDIEGDAIIVSFSPDSPLPKKSQPVGLYVYRPQIGGYLLDCRMEESWSGGLRLLFLGSIHDQGQQHLMARMTVPLVLTPWSPPSPLPKTQVQPPEQSRTDGAEQTDGQPTEGESPPVEQEEPEPPIQCESERISDRGLLFVSGDPRLKTPLVNGLWEIDTEIGDGFRLTCRGRILPARPGSGRFVFRFIDLSENARRILMAEIKKHGGEREQLV